jgi:hypothetical protein
MSDIAEDIDELGHRREELEQWWEESRGELTEQQRQCLFERAIEDKFAFLPIVIGLTVDIPEGPDELVGSLERLSPYLNRDMAWGDLYSELHQRLCSNPNLAEEIYYDYSILSEDWAKPYAGPVLAALPEEKFENEIIDLLRSEEVEKVEMAVSGLVGRSEYEISDDILEELEGLADNSESHFEVLRVCSEYFRDEERLWDLTKQIGYENPDVVPQISRMFGRNVEQPHFEEYVELVEYGIKQDSGESPEVHRLYNEFAEEADVLAEFTVGICDKDMMSARRLVKNVAEENQAILEALYDRMGDYPSDFHFVEVVFAAAEENPKRLVELVIDRYDDSTRVVSLQLLKKAVGELFFSTRYEREVARDIAAFLSNVEDSGFVRSVKHSLVNQVPDEDIEECHNKDVFYHLYSVISDQLEGRNYDQSTLDFLEQYPDLDSHFRSQLLSKIRQRQYHPMLGLIANQSADYLEFLDDNWGEIPSEKQQQLLGEAFRSTLSEIGLILWVQDRELEFELDVNLHHHNTREELEKDVDLVVDGHYIEIRTPRTWRNLEVSNRTIGLPNTAYNQISGKFKSDYAGSAELTEEPVFIALDITESEIHPEEVVASFYGSLQIQLQYDRETGEVVDERPTRDRGSSLEGWDLLDDNLNGVIWYTARIPATGGSPSLQVEGDVVPNPHHQNEDNFDLCESLSQRLFDSG